MRARCLSPVRIGPVLIYLRQEAQFSAECTHAVFGIERSFGGWRVEHQKAFALEVLEIPVLDRGKNSQVENLAELGANIFDSGAQFAFFAKESKLRPERNVHDT